MLDIAGTEAMFVGSLVYGLFEELKNSVTLYLPEIVSSQQRCISCDACSELIIIFISPWFDSHRKNVICSLVPIWNVMTTGNATILG